MTQPETLATRATTSADACFLCALDQAACAVAQVAGALLGAAFEQKDGRNVPVLGLRTREGERIKVNLNPNDRALAQRLSELSQEAQRLITVRCCHLQLGKANPPAPGKEPFRVLHALPATLVIIEPDLLLNITDLSNGDYCVRQELLRQIFPGPPTAAGVRGTIIHNIFKELLKDKDAIPERLLDDGLRTSAAQLAEVRAHENEVRAEIEPHLASLDAWRMQQRSRLWKSAPRIRAETFLLAPEVGLKGRLDILWEDGDERRLLELKTGRAAGELPKKSHRWQVEGYHLLLAARRSGRMRNAPQATLLYSGTPHAAEQYAIPVSFAQMKQVIGIRNELALVRVTGTVPPPPGGNKCLKCATRIGCAETSSLLGWTMPPGDPPLPIDALDAAWFRRWFTLQRLEGRESDKATVGLWSQKTNERIESGAAIGNLTLIEPPTETEKHEWIYRFRCDNTSELREGDEILLSDGDPVRGAVVSGTILQLSAGEIACWAREDLPWLAANPHAATLIDRYSADVVNRRMLHNLTRWLHLDDHRRALVRGDARPRIDSDPPMMNPTALIGLNGEQADAVVKALAMKDYLLIQGPPGTGKTNVIASIAQAMLGRGYRVALAAFTNQATDTMLRRLVDAGVTNVVRLGHEFAIAPDLRRYRLKDQARTRVPDREPLAEDIRAVLQSVPLVAGTVASWSAEAFEVDETMPIFDVVILDEATQLTLPATLGALRWARRFILVGDQQQLPPLVQSEAARVNGLGVSLFETLGALHPHASVALRRQYRMHAAISAFPSQAFYGGALQADASVKDATLPITPARYGDLLDPARPLVWASVTPHSAAAKVNEAEAQAAADLARALCASGMQPAEIGIIAPFRAQVARIRQLAGELVENGLTVDTVDRFQGGERAAIILSLVAAEPPLAESQLARFLGDPHRLNVALTRARHKLIILGHRPALGHIPLLRDLAAHCEATGCVMPYTPQS